MTEAVKRVLDYCFDTLNLDAVSVGHFEENEKSKRVIQKCGFKFAGTGVYNAKQLGKSFTDIKYILLKENRGEC